MGITTAKDLRRIADNLNLEDYDYTYIGLRIVDQGYDGYDLPAGSLAPNSYRWDDGNWTDDELDGASCIAFGHLFSGGYLGRRVWLIGGDYASWGEDSGELVIRDAKILAIFDI